MINKDTYKRLTKKDKYGHWYTETKINDRFMWSKDGKVWERDLSHYAFDGEAIDRLAELEDKIENGTLIEVDKNIIGEGIIGIQCYMDGTLGVCLDENIVIGFDTDGVVTWNNVHEYNDYFKNGCYFIDNEKGRTQLKAKLRELKGNKNE